MKLFLAWIIGISLILALYLAGNPFGFYDDFVISGVLIFLTVRWRK